MSSQSSVAPAKAGLKLSASQIAHFRDQGYLVIEDVLPQEKLERVLAEYDRLVAGLCRRHGLADEGDFRRRLGRLLSHDPGLAGHLDISLPMTPGITEESGFHGGDAVFAVMTDSRVLDVAEHFVGPEIYSNPIQHVRINLPESELSAEARKNSNLAQTLWHQDSAVGTEDGDNTEVLTVWIAISDATIANGCMYAAAGSHKGKPKVRHCPGREHASEIFVPDADLSGYRLQPLEVGAGGLVLLSAHIVHGAGPNTSEEVRFSFDLRYQKTGLPTGRDCFPGFVCRSRSRPAAELPDARAWRKLWRQAREDIVAGRVEARFNSRWEKFRQDRPCA